MVVSSIYHFTMSVLQQASSAAEPSLAPTTLPAAPLPSPLSTTPPARRDRRRAPSASGPPAPGLLRSLSGLTQASTQGTDRHVAYSLARMASHETAEIGLGHDKNDEPERGRSGKEIAEEAAEGVIEASAGDGVAAGKAGSVAATRPNHDSEKTFVEGGKAESGPTVANDMSEASKSKEPEIMDQTNLLPIRQVIVVFAGLSAALFCCLLDQTM